MRLPAIDSTKQRMPRFLESSPLADRCDRRPAIIRFRESFAIPVRVRDRVEALLPIIAPDNQRARELKDSLPLFRARG